MIRDTLFPPFLAAAALALVFGAFAVPLLGRWHFRQNIYELSPAAHRAKQGIPTMGGLFFGAAAMIAGLAFGCGGGLWIAVCALSSAAFSFLGGVDDVISIRRSRNLGLKPMQKIVPQAVLALALAYAGMRLNGTGWYVPFSHGVWDLKWAYIPVTAFAVVATVNSANLLDGLDGLCGGCSCVTFSCFGAAACVLVQKGACPQEAGAAAAWCAACAGALLGYLAYNSSPAKVFMGDTGSFFIGGALSAAAVLTGTELLIPIAAFPMLMSSLSDILQVFWCRTHGGKRLFRMAPLHHHFEMGGVPEQKIVSCYMIANVLLALAALAGV